MLANHPKNKMSVNEDEPPFLSVELEVRFGCRTKTSQGYHVTNTVAWSGEVVETFQGSFRLDFIDISVHYPNTGAVSRRTALSSVLQDCFDCSRCTEPLLRSDQYLSVPSQRVMPLCFDGEPLSLDLRKNHIYPRQCKFPNCQRVYLYFTAKNASVTVGPYAQRRWIVMKIPRYNEYGDSYRYFYRQPRSQQ